MVLAALGVAMSVATGRAAVPNPTVTGPITAVCSPMCPSPPGPANGIHIPDAFDGGSNLQEFIDADYVEEEFFFEGTATAFERDPGAPAWDSTGSWTARPSTTIAPAAYKSRVLVNRPADPTKFNGIVVLEWFNETAGIDLPPDYGYYRTQLRREGAIFVGVSAQAVGINGGVPAGFALKSWDPVRYGSLVHPGDNYCYDIFSQAAQAIRNPSGLSPIPSDYHITGMIADGESQSAGRMVTYVDAIAPLAQVFDGYFIHSRGAAGSGLFSGAGGTVPSPSKIRSDVPPVLVFETETDTAGHFNARQPDGPNYRLWEPAGTAHVDNYDFTFFNQNAATSEPSYPPTVCNFPNNMANEHYVMNAALFHLGNWITGGAPPPNAPAPISVVSGAIQRDANNIALGGIRLPEMDVPIATHQGTGNTGSPFCVLFGRTIPLPVPLSSLYPTHDAYVGGIHDRDEQSPGRRLHPPARRGRDDRGRAELHRRDRLRQRRARGGGGVRRRQRHAGRWLLRHVHGRDGLLLHRRAVDVRADLRRRPRDRPRAVRRRQHDGRRRLLGDLHGRARVQLHGQSVRLRRDLRRRPRRRR